MRIFYVYFLPAIQCEVFHIYDVLANKFEYKTIDIGQNEKIFRGETTKKNQLKYFRFIHTPELYNKIRTQSN